MDVPSNQPKFPTGSLFRGVFLMFFWGQASLIPLYVLWFAVAGLASPYFNPDFETIGMS